MQTSANTNYPEKKSELPGDPNCPICHGLGWIRKELPVHDPDFGRLQICECKKESAAQATHLRLLRLSNLDTPQFKKMTFDNFKVQGRFGLSEDQEQSLQYALNQAIRFAQNPSGWLLITGKYGCGKTHLAVAIANTIVENGDKTLLLTVPDLLDWLRFAYGKEGTSFEDRFEEIKNINLLVLDDLGTQNATSWAQEKLFQIINYRYINQLPMVITTNVELSDIEERIRSRIKDPDSVTSIRITAPDYRDPMQDSNNQPHISSLATHSQQTFGNFSLRERDNIDDKEKQSLAKAFKAAQLFAENPTGWLVFLGSYGSGKTHLAAAIGNHPNIQRQNPIFVFVPDLLDHLRATFSPNSQISYDRLFEEVRSADVLILDDLGTHSATPWAREKLYQLLNHRYNANLPTVITTSTSLEDTDPRIRSRMMDNRICKINTILTEEAFTATQNYPETRHRGRSKKN